MKNKQELIGAVLIGLGCGLAAVGVALVIPACANWSRGLIEDVLPRSKKGITSAAGSIASLAGQISGMAQRKFQEGSEIAREKPAEG
jgi:hypothetical protein